MKKVLYRLLLFLVVFGTMAFSVPVWAVPVLNQDNGHYYERIDDEVTWAESKRLAEGKTYMGLSGHLVTITSREENWWIVRNLGGPLTLDHYLGGYQEEGAEEPDGGWKWVTGEPWEYTNWGWDEPNGNKHENFLGFDDRESAIPVPGFWNDGSGGRNEGYIVEYEPAFQGSITGVITDAFTGIGIGGATVTLNPGGFSTITISSSPFGQIGLYLLSGLYEGVYDVSVSASDYNPTVESGVQVSAGVTTRLNISLAPEQTEHKIAFDFDPPCGEVGNPVAITVNSTVGGRFYKYLVNPSSYCGPTGPDWQIVEDWTTDTTVTWAPSYSGRHTIVVWIADDINETCHQMTGASYEVGASDCIDPIEVSLAPATQAINEPVTISVTGGESDLQYAFWANDVSHCDTSQSANWVLLQDWSLSNSCTYTPTSETTYTFVVWTAKDTSDPCYGMGGMTYRVSSYGGGGEGYWNFNEESGSVAYDTSGHGNDGVIYGARRESSICGNALVFDGDDDYAEIPDHSSLDMPNGITIEAWVKVEELGVDIPRQRVKTVVTKDQNGELHVNYNGCLQGNAFSDDGTQFPLKGTTSLTLGEWYHIAMTCEADGSMKLYVNGNEDASTPFTGNLMINSSPVHIGQDHFQYPNRYFKGTIDDVHIYGRALTESEIQEDMECGTSPFEDCVTGLRARQEIDKARVSVTRGKYSSGKQRNAYNKFSE